MFAYTYRRDRPICMKRGMLILWDPEVKKDDLNSERVLSSIPSEGG
jgi:hypothetical protein